MRTPLFISGAFRGYQQGVIATVPAVCVASAVAALLDWPSPLEALAEQLMQWTPVSVAEVLLFHFGALARPAALLGALAIAMLAGGLAGLVRSLCDHLNTTTVVRFSSGWGCAAVWQVSVFLFIIRPSIPEPEIVFVLAYLVSLAMISRPLRAPVSSRRQFLERSVLILGGAATLVTLFSVRPLLRALATQRLFPFLRPRGLRIAGISDLVTDENHFYVMDKVLQYPEIGPPDWKLTISGAVDHPMTLDYGSLLALPKQHRYVTMECVDNPVGGPLMSNALWTGVSLAHLLRAVGAHGDTVVFHAPDVYAEGAPRQLLETNNALIAYGMNGKVLPRMHGYPARLVLPGIYGFKSVKWLTGIEVLEGTFQGHWRGHGWTESAHVHTTTRIDVTRRVGDAILVAGVAFAGTRGISAVEVQVNGGPWHRASLGPILSNDSWVQWEIHMHGPGKANIQVRAVDGHGAVQTRRRHGAYPEGATGWSSAVI